MSRKRYKLDQIINLFLEAEVALSRSQTVGEVCRSLGISKQCYYRWRSEYRGMKLEQVKRLNELEKENVRLKKAVRDELLNGEIFYT